MLIQSLHRAISSRITQSAFISAVEMPSEAHIGPSPNILSHCVRDEIR